MRVTVLMYYFCVRHLHSAKSHSWVLEEFEIRINNYIEVFCTIYMGKIWRLWNPILFVPFYIHSRDIKV